MESNVIIFGTSSGANEVLSMINSNVFIVAYLDNNKMKQGKLFNGKEVIAPSDIHKIKYNYIIIASYSHEDEMITQLLGEGVSREYILTPLAKLGGRKKKYYIDKYKELSLYEDMFTRQAIESMFNDYAFCSMNHQSSKRRSIFLYDYPDYSLTGIDYVRLSTVELLSREIIENEITGAIAELGVYKGDFTKLLSNLFSERTLYLFDTFEGFSEKDVKTEQHKRFSKAQVGHFGDTNVNLVLDRLPNNSNVVVRKGYFPDTAKDLQHEAYAFVSIDVDLYKPTYEGLHYFYDKLSNGGYIIIHDYNFDTYKGVKEAVQKFAKEKCINYVPVSDYFGSVVITK